MSGMLPPPPPRHPSSRQSPSRRPPPSPPPTVPHLAVTTLSPPLATQTTAEPALVPHSIPSLPPAPNSAVDSLPPPPPPPPLHPSRSTPSRSTSPSLLFSEAPPPPKHPSLPPPDAPSAAVQEKLRNLEDREIHELLERVGGQLTDLRVASDDEDEEGMGAELLGDWPDKRAFTAEDGGMDWAAYGLACFLHVLISLTPSTLLSSSSPTPPRFSLRRTRILLERLYVLLPPATWEPFLLVTLPALYRWEDPAYTGAWAAAYALLVATDLVLAFPVGVLVYYLARARLFPPAPEELLRQAEERAERSKEAKELGKQLQSSAGSGRFGISLAGEGVKGVWSEVKERVTGRDDDGGDEKSIKTGLGSSALLGGLAGLSKETADKLRHRSFSHPRTSSSPSTTSPADAASTAPTSPPSPTSPASTEPARGVSGKPEDVSLYRLARNLARRFGPHLQMWAEEVAELGEGIKNILLHPTHPSSLPILLRLSAVLLFMLLCPAWALYKLLWLYVGVEFFVLWAARETWPQYRRALMPVWWIFHSAPSDADYALYVLRERGKEGVPLRGAKTLKRAERREKGEGKEGGGGVRGKIVQRLPLPRSLSSPSNISGSEAKEKEAERLIGTYFALHLSTPGTLLLTPSTLSFRPTRKLRHLGKLASRLSSSPPSPSASSPSSASLLTPDDASNLSVSTAGTGSAWTAGTGTSGYTAGSREMVEVEVGEVRGVRKERGFAGVGEGLVVSTRDGVYRFTNVAKRDECFNKLVSVTGASWEVA
ncbi:hypothetical protein JCM6882_009002 [Rhodosporidiobolus microsporus]